MLKENQKFTARRGENEYGNSYLGQTIQQTLRRESLHFAAAEKYMCWQTEDGQEFGYNTDDQYLLDFMPQLRQLYDCIMDGEKQVVAPTFVRWAKLPGIKLTELGRKVWDACRYFASQEEDRRNWKQAYAHHVFHPIIAVMLKAVMRWWHPICQWHEPSHALVEGENREAVKMLRRFVDFVRRVCRSRAFQNALHDHERKSEDNFKSGCDYLIAMFERHARLLILRIDLYFRPDFKGWGYGEAADKALISYLRALTRGRLVPGFLGVKVKRENGISRGMHFHLMVLIDADDHRNAWFLTQTLGEAWMKRVGHEKGSYFNCYARKDRYLYNGLGVVHVSDVEKLIGVRVALWYMSKQDSVLKVDNRKKKNFWGSLMPNKPDGRGAPRKNRNSMDLVRRILGGSRSKYPPGFELPKQERAKRHGSAQTGPGGMAQVALQAEGQSQGL